MLGNESYMDFGWSTTRGILKDENGTTVYPWDRQPMNWDIPETSDYQFSIDATEETPATFSINGEPFYFGAHNGTVKGSPSSVTGTDLGRVIYMNHGSRIIINGDEGYSPVRPYNAFSDATIAMRIWKKSESGLNTTITLPGDQMKLATSIQPYDIDMTKLIQTDFDDANFDDDRYIYLSALTGAGLGTEVRIAWDKISPVAGVDILGYPDMFRSFEHARGITISTGPVVMPQYGLIHTSTGDYLDQLSVSGATIANPFAIFMSGGDDGISQIREVISATSDYTVPGEGGNARFYMDRGARLGLGCKDWNDNSERAWSLLGKNAVALRPNGNCQIDVNSNLTLVDAQPIVPTTNFGSDNTQHRITFFSHDTREIRVPAGTEFDLSAFGQPTNTTFSAIQGEERPRTPTR